MEVFMPSMFMGVPMPRVNDFVEDGGDGDLDEIGRSTQGYGYLLAKSGWQRLDSVVFEGGWEF